MYFKTCTLLIIFVVSSALFGCSSSVNLPNVNEDLALNLISKIDMTGPPLAPERVVIGNAAINQLKQKMKNMKNPEVGPGEYAVIETSYGFIVFELMPEVAPNLCANFKKLANNGFYDWVSFHRVIPGFMIQTGSVNTKNDNPIDDGTGSLGYLIDAEFSKVAHLRGIVSAARKASSTRAGSQFFIIVQPSRHLDNEYTVFGNVIYGMQTADRIVRARKDKNDKPLESIYVKRIRVIKSGM